jgi:diguanylate cyclase (GGDEF)-like protein
MGLVPDWDGAVSAAGRADAATRAGRLAAFLYELGALYMLATAGQLPSYAGERIWAGALAAALTGAVLLVLPWHRFPPVASLGPPLWAFVVLVGPIGWYAHALSQYLLLYTLLFLYVGLTQPRWTSIALSPVALLSLLPVLLEDDLPPATLLVSPVLVAIALGELVGVLAARQTRAREHLGRLLDATQGLHAATSTREAADVVARLASTLLGADGALVLLREAPGSPVLVSVNAAHAPEQPGGVRIDLGGGSSGTRQAMLSGRVVFAAEAESDDALDQALVARFGVASALFVPLGDHGSFEGVAVAVFHRRRRSIDVLGQRAAEVIASQAGQVLRRTRESAALQDLAATDPLTGLANRRTFFSQLADVDRGDSVVFLDLDHFKNLNDTRGHQAGDAVLRSFAATLRDVVRQPDACARYGGEEFAVLLRATSAAAATEVLARLRSRWAVEAPGVTFSAGVAEHQDRSPTETLAAADAALYEAKRAGRSTDRVAPPAAAADVVRLSDRRRSDAG